MKFKRCDHCRAEIDFAIDSENHSYHVSGASDRKIQLQAKVTPPSSGNALDLCKSCLADSLEEWAKSYRASNFDAHLGRRRA